MEVMKRALIVFAAWTAVALAVAVGCAALEGALKWAFGLYRTPHTLSSGVGAHMNQHYDEVQYPVCRRSALA